MRSKSVANLFFVLLLLSFLISCKKEVEPLPDPGNGISVKAYTKQTPDETTVFQPNAIFVKSDINKLFVSYSEDGVLTFNKDSALNIIKTGDVLYSLPTKDFPDGYALRVTKINPVKVGMGVVTLSNTWSCQTEPASISNVFKEYNGSSDMQIAADAEDNSAYDFLTDQQDGSYLFNSSPFGAISQLRPNFEMKNILDTYQAKKKISKNNCTRLRSLKIGGNETTLEYIVYDIDGKYCTVNDQVVLEMKLNYDFTKTKLSIAAGKFNLKGQHKWSSQATLKYSFEKDWTEAEKANFKEEFKKKVVGKKYNVFSMPAKLPSLTDVIVKPTFDVFYELKLDLNGNIKVVAGMKDYTYDFNINNSKEKAFTLIKQAQYFSDIEVGADIEAGMRFGLGITYSIPVFKLLNANSIKKESYAGLYADFGADATFKVSVKNEATNTTCLNIKTDYEADAGVYFEYKIPFINDIVWQDKISIYTTPSFKGSLLDYEKCLAKDWVPKGFTKVVAGYNSSYAINASGNLFGWGLLNGLATSKVPVQLGNASWSSVSDGINFSLGIQSNGSFWGWGLNDYGQMGDGSNVNNYTGVPNSLPGNDWKEISCGGHYAIGIKTDGSLWSWGLNDYGQLGIGNNPIISLSPVRIGTSNNWKTISCYLLTSMAIKNDGTLWSWGENWDGRIVVVNNLPQQVGNDSDWSQVDVSATHTMAIKNDGSLWGWGRNTEGALGKGNLTTVSAPVRIDATTDWTKVEVGSVYTVAQKKDGSLWSTGTNNLGQLGIGSNSQKDIFTQINADKDWKDFSVGSYHVLAVKTDGSLWSWGNNAYGTLGDGTTTNKNAPVKIK